ncbi:2-hydroxyacid dehydrogenase [Sandarakinorhabdus sp. DWP1-3-1]|uniref:2-hydroxyacid dehydrogenase n=1 Tax=Sandarakinorhabdus sp. DWP1-3-1 TaxID=2804627 RepID=UPI003CEAA37C
MKTLFIAARSDPEAMAAMFRAELPGHDVVTKAPGDRPVHYAVVGKPLPGTLSSLTGLELVLSLNAGIEHLLASGEVPEGVPIVRMVDPGLVEGMVEWVAAQLLAWHRNLFVYRDQQAAGEWRQHGELMARERVVTVLGAGALGGPVATMLAALGFQVRTWSRSGRAVAGTATFGGDDLAAAVAGADALINLLPATAATTDIIDAALLARLAPGALLVNAGRGAAVVDGDVLAALDAGQLSAAVLDVFRTEPLPADHPFWAHPRVLVSPHVAAPTHARTAVAVMADSVRRHERGEPVPHVVDRSLGY